MNALKIAELTVEAAKEVLAILPTIEADIAAARSSPAWPLLVKIYPQAETLTAETAKALGEFSAIASKLKPILDLL